MQLFPNINLSEIKNSRVLVRVAFDLPFLQDRARIINTLPTIQQLLNQHNTVILATKWGRPKGVSEESLSTKHLIDPIAQCLFSHSISSELVYFNQFEQGFDSSSSIFEVLKYRIVLLENLHFDNRETSKIVEERVEIANKYAGIADYYVDEAFASSHRQEATNTEIKQILPWCFGSAYSQELTFLDKIRTHPTYPFTVIMAGAKLETKLPLINKMINKASILFVSGMLCFTFMEAKKRLGLESVDIGDSPIEEDFIQEAQTLLQNHGDKIILPVDFTFSHKDDGTKVALDIGPATIELLESKLSGTKTLFWNGTMGYVEKPPFDQGTLAIAKLITNLQDCTTVVGGGDTVASLDQDLINKFDFVSMGGGATLEYLSAD